MAAIRLGEYRTFPHWRSSNNASGQRFHCFRLRPAGPGHISCSSPNFQTCRSSDKHQQPPPIHCRVCATTETCRHDTRNRIRTRRRQRWRHPATVPTTQRQQHHRHRHHRRHRLLQRPVRLFLLLLQYRRCRWQRSSDQVPDMTGPDPVAVAYPCQKVGPSSHDRLIRFPAVTSQASVTVVSRERHNRPTAVLRHPPGRPL